METETLFRCNKNGSLDIVCLENTKIGPKYTSMSQGFQKYSMILLIDGWIP